MFKSADLSLAWSETEATASTPKGTFRLDSLRAIAVPCNDHKKPFEARITCKGQTLYVCCESMDARAALLSCIGAA